MEAQIGLTAEMYRAEERVGRLEEAMERLAQAQAHTEERVGRLEEAMERLAQAQARTDASVRELAQAQARTDASVRELAQAQARTEAALQELARQMTALRQEVGSLAENIGFGLEDVARTVLPGYLERHYGLKLEGPLGEELGRRFFEVQGQPVEVNLYGEGQRDGQKVVVLGEAKSRIGGSEVQKFARNLGLIEPLTAGEVWRVMFAFYIHPTATQPAAENNILLVASYQR